MDKYIFEQFITKIDGKDASNFFKYLLMNSQEKIDTKERRYLQYYPQKEKAIKLVVETSKNKEGKLNIDGFKFHHLSNQEWEFKIVTPIKSFPNTYIVKRSNNTGSSCIRLVNEEIIGKELKPGTTIKGQVCGIVMSADIFKNEDAYREKVPVDKKGNKTVMNDGYLIPFNLITNNDAKLSEEERNKRDHRRDNLLTFKSKLKNVEEVEISMFDVEIPNYYKATIDTTDGELDIIIPRPIVNKYKERLTNGNTIIGELLLSCDLCIGKYTDKVEKN